MKIFKKILIALLAISMTAAFAACSSDEKADTNTADTTAQTENTEQTGDTAETGDAEEPEEKETLVMATNAEFPPYEYWENDKVTGIDAEIAALIADKLGMDLEINDMDFAVITSAVQSGKADIGMAGMTVNEDRLESVNFTTPYATGRQVIIVKDDSPITCVDDLMGDQNYNIGVQETTTGDIYTTDDIEAKGLGTVSRYNKGADAVAALVAGKVDCVVIDNEPAKQFVAQNEGLKILDTEYIVEDYAICYAKDNTELGDKINTVLEELIDDGSVQQIIDKYITAD